MYGKYLTMNQYDGSLGGLMPNPAGPHDVSSPGGLSDIQHHWTRGMFGIPETTTDVYAGTGDRYIAAEYGNLYQPASHGYVNEFYHGPKSRQTEYVNLEGQPYFWMNTAEYRNQNPSGQKKMFENSLTSNNAKSQYYNTYFPSADTQSSSLPHNPPYRKPLDTGIENFIPEEGGSGDFDLIGSSEDGIPQNNPEESPKFKGSIHDLPPLPQGKAMQNALGADSNLSLSTTGSRNVTPHLKKYLSHQGTKKRSTPIGSKQTVNAPPEPENITALPEYEGTEHFGIKKNGRFIYVVIIVAILIISTIAIELWASSAMKFLHNLHGKDIALPRLLLYATTITIFLIIIMHLIGVDVKDVI